MSKQTRHPMGSRGIRRFFSNSEILMDILQNTVPVKYIDEVYAWFRDHELEFDFYDVNFEGTKDSFKISCYARKAGGGRFSGKSPLEPFETEIRYDTLRSFTLDTPVSC